MSRIPKRQSSDTLATNGEPQWVDSIRRALDEAESIRHFRRKSVEVHLEDPICKWGTFTKCKFVDSENALCTEDNQPAETAISKLLGKRTTKSKQTEKKPKKPAAEPKQEGETHGADGGYCAVVDTNLWKEVLAPSNSYLNQELVNWGEACEESPINASDSQLNGDLSWWGVRKDEFLEIELQRLRVERLAREVAEKTRRQKQEEDVRRAERIAREEEQMKHQKQHQQQMQFQMHQRDADPRQSRPFPYTRQHVAPQPPHPPPIQHGYWQNATGGIRPGIYPPPTSYGPPYGVMPLMPYAQPLYAPPPPPFPNLRNSRPPDIPPPPSLSIPVHTPKYPSTSQKPQPTPPQPVQHEPKRILNNSAPQTNGEVRSSQDPKTTLLGRVDVKSGHQESQQVPRGRPSEHSFRHDDRRSPNSLRDNRSLPLQESRQLPPSREIDRHDDRRERRRSPITVRPFHPRESERHGGIRRRSRSHDRSEDSHGHWRPSGHGHERRERSRSRTPPRRR